MFITTIYLERYFNPDLMPHNVPLCVIFSAAIVSPLKNPEVQNTQVEAFCHMAQVGQKHSCKTFKLRPVSEQREYC